MFLIYNSNFIHNSNSYLTLAIERAAKRVFGAEIVKTGDNRTLAKMAASGKFSILICIDGQRLDSALISRVKPAFSRTILWIFEDPFMISYHLAQQHLFDYIFTNDPECADLYTNGFYLPMAGSKDLNVRKIRAESEFDYDIFFAGTMWPNRIKTVERIISCFPDLSLKLVCPTNEYLPPLPKRISDRAIKWAISHENFIDFANASRVALTIFRDYSVDGKNNQSSGPGPRLFELALAGTKQIVELPNNAQRHFYDVVEGLTLVDEQTILSEIEKSISNSAQRINDANKSQQSALQSHTYDERLKQIASVCGVSESFHQNNIINNVTSANKRRMRVLMCTHSVMGMGIWGGIEVYQEAIKKHLSKDVEIFFWLRQSSKCKLLGATGEILEQFYIEPKGDWLEVLSDREEEEAFSRIISSYNIDIVHFQHLGSHALSLPIVANNLGVGNVLSAHDFFMVCSRYDLIDFEGKYCNISRKHIGTCDICLHECSSIQPGAQATRRSFMKEIIKSVDMFLFGTECSREISMSIYPSIIESKTTILPIPLPEQFMPVAKRTTAHDRGEVLRVALLGNFLRKKGGSVALSIFSQLSSENYEFHIIGRAEGDYERVLSDWPNKNVIYHGAYKMGDYGILSSCDVALYLSLWPETYCISLSESWKAGVVPIACNIGALSDRIDHNTNGFIVPVNDANAVVEILELLRCVPDTLSRIKSQINEDLWMEAETHCNQLINIYRSVQPAAQFGKVTFVSNIERAHLIPHTSWRSLAPPRTIFDADLRPNLALDLPDTVENWSLNEDIRYHVDDIGYAKVSDVIDHSFEPLKCQFRGWSYLKTTGLSSDRYIGMIGLHNQLGIFIKASSSERFDVQQNESGAPSHSGFNTIFDIRGSWGNGVYTLCLFHVLDRVGCAVTTSFVIKIDGGKIVEISRQQSIAREALENYFDAVTGARYQPTVKHTVRESIQQAAGNIKKVKLFRPLQNRSGKPQ